MYTVLSVKSRDLEQGSCVLLLQNEWSRPLLDGSTVFLF
jgi:hypothetical protein